MFFAICYVVSLIGPIYTSHINQTFESKIRAFSNSFDSFIQTIFIALGFYLYGELSTRLGFSLTAQYSFIFPVIAAGFAGKYLWQQKQQTTGTNTLDETSSDKTVDDTRPD